MSAGVIIAVSLTVISLASLIFFVGAFHASKVADDRDQQLIDAIEQGDIRLADFMILTSHNPPINSEVQ